MGGIALAWLAGEAMVCWRWAEAGAPPPPGALARSSIIFVALALLAEYQPARTFAAVAAWGVDLALLVKNLNSPQPKAVNWPPPLINDPDALLPTGTSSSSSSPSSSSPAATPPGVPGPAPAGTPVPPGLTPAQQKYFSQHYISGAQIG